MADASSLHPPAPGLAELARIYARIGVLSFGGPAAQIALMQRVLVDERRWLSEAEFLSALSFCMVLPGPEAMQLATWSGWRLHGTAGGLIAGLLFVLPGALIVLGLAMIYAAFGAVPVVDALFTGVQAAVVVIVVEALLRLSRRALVTVRARALAVMAFAALFLFGLPFPLIIAVAGLVGFLSVRTAVGPAAPAVSVPVDAVQNIRTALIWAAVWVLPLILLWALDGGILFEIGLFFAKLALMTFGGAYAVLAWMAQAVVVDKGWLTLPQMIDGLGLAETTPGPLILVTEFVGFMAAFRQGGLAYGVAGAVVTLWMTFVPCFLFIFTGAPWIARITAAPRLGGAMAAIMAAVVGVIAHLSVWFALHVFFTEVRQVQVFPVSVVIPNVASLDGIAVILVVLSGWMLFLRRLSLPLVLAVTAGASVILRAPGL